MIAVITPVYNGALSIQKSINSLLNQTYTNWINIIVNDGSTDDTYTILESLKNDDRFIIIHLNENKGRGYARNIALNKAKDMAAKYMCMLDADDVYHQAKLLEQFNYMEKNEHFVLSSSSIGVLNKKGLYRIYEVSNQEKFYLYSAYENLEIVPHASSIIRLDKVDVQFNTELKFAEDQDFMRRLLIGKKYSFVPKILYYYNRNESFSISKYKKSLDANIDSFTNLDVSSAFLKKMFFMNALKIAIFSFLVGIGLEKIYYNKIGRKPTDSEIENYLYQKLALNYDAQ